MLWLAKVIIFASPQYNYYFKGDPSLISLIPRHKLLLYQNKFKGLPIGNYSSQFFANIYLNKLDYFIKKKLKVKYYLRYVDDFVILHNDYNELLNFKKNINIFLNKYLKLKLNHNKTKIKTIDDGIDFFGYFIKPKFVLARKKTVKRIKNKIYFINNHFKRKSIKDRDKLRRILSVINSYYGHLKHSCSYKLRLNIYNDHLKDIKNFFEFEGGNLKLNN